MEEFIVTFRESLEAALIVGIIFSYLIKTNKKEFIRFVYGGLVLGILGSALGAIAFYQIIGEFSGTSEQIFEGVTMSLGAILIVYLIVWMSNKKDSASTIKEQVEQAIGINGGLGILFLVFISILREGVETTLFLNAVASNQSGISVVSGLLGVVGGVLVGYGVYIGLKGMNLRYLFSASSALLILFATGLFAHGVHEFQEASLIPTFVEHIWDMNHMLDENGFVGSFLKSLFGYNGNPSLIEALVYLSSLTMMILVYNYKSTKLKKATN